MQKSAKYNVIQYNALRKNIYKNLCLTILKIFRKRIFSACCCAGCTSCVLSPFLIWSKQKISTQTARTQTLTDSFLSKDDELNWFMYLFFRPHWNLALFAVLLHLSETVARRPFSFTLWALEHAHAFLRALVRCLDFDFDFVFVGARLMKYWDKFFITLKLLMGKKIHMLLSDNRKCNDLSRNKYDKCNSLEEFFEDAEKHCRLRRWLL